MGACRRRLLRDCTPQALGAYPLTEDGQQRAAPTTLSNLSVGWWFRGARLRVAATLLNAFDAVDSDIQYWYASRGQLEPADGIEDLPFKPIEPRRLRVGVAWGL